MFCSNCGSEVDNNDKFCWNCGAKMHQIEKSIEQVSAQSIEGMQPVRKTIEEIDQEFDINALPTKKESGIRSIYIIDFITRMMSKSNIPLFIYLLLNVVLIGLFVTAVCALPVYWGLLCGLILYIASISIALSPIGEAILRHQNGCRKIEEQAIIERLYPLFREVYYNAKKRNPTISDDVRLFISEDESPNAFATGRKTMCVTRGLLERSDEEIKGVLGHEFGHLANKDTDRVQVVGVGNTVITGIAVMFQLGVIITEAIMHIVAIMKGDEDSWLIALFGTLSRVITLFMINVFMKLWNLLGTALCMKTSRNNEYEADEFSVHLGYADGLATMLAYVGGEKPNGLFACLASSHPASTDRIARIKSLCVKNGTVGGV